MFKGDKAIPAVVALACFLSGLAPAWAAGDVASEPMSTEGFTIGATPIYEGEGAGAAYGGDLVRCPRCGKVNEAAAAECERCGYDYHLASASAGDGGTVFFGGKSYSRDVAPAGPPGNEPVDFPEGRVWHNPGPLAKAGTVLFVVGAGTVIVGLGMMLYELYRALSDKDSDLDNSLFVASAGLVVMTTGIFLTIIDLSFRAEGDCGFAPGTPEVGGGCGRRPGGLMLKCGLSFSPM